jgi:tRNA pseudouridine38-40 synthase
MAKPTLFPESGSRRLRIELSYDGTNFAGWAKQPDQRTLQEELESALSKLAHDQINTVVAGRTDAGVHALQQFVHCDIAENPPHADMDWDISNWAYRLNRILDEDIRIHKVDYAPEGFHARFSASARHYTYKIADGLMTLPPLERFDVAPWYRHLDLDLMNEVSAHMLGEHDFSAFCKYREGSTTIRTLTKFNWYRLPNGYLAADVSADAFCYSMVRNLVGAAACVGEGRFPKEWMLKMLENRERVPDSIVFPGRGLTLVKVDFPADELLAEKAAQSMAWRMAED